MATVERNCTYCKLQRNVIEYAFVRSYNARITECDSRTAVELDAEAA